MKKKYKNGFEASIRRFRRELILRKIRRWVRSIITAIILGICLGIIIS